MDNSQTGGGRNGSMDSMLITRSTGRAARREQGKSEKAADVGEETNCEKTDFHQSENHNLQ